MSPMPGKISCDVWHGSFISDETAKSRFQWFGLPVSVSALYIAPEHRIPFEGGDIPAQHGGNHVADWTSCGATDKNRNLAFLPAGIAYDSSDAINHYAADAP